jgi:hypothetical protein
MNRVYLSCELGLKIKIKERERKVKTRGCAGEF